MTAQEEQSSMYMLPLLQQAQAILRLSDEMYLHAEQADWLMFTEREAKRQKMLDNLFAHPQINSELKNLATILRKVMLIDKKSIALGECEKQRLGSKVSGFKQHRQAAQVYQLVSIN